MGIILRSELTASLESVEAGKVKIFFDGADNNVKFKRSDGTINFFLPSSASNIGSGLSVYSGSSPGLFNTFVFKTLQGISGVNITETTGTINIGTSFSESFVNLSNSFVNFSASYNRFNVSGSTATTFLVNTASVGKYIRLSSSSGINVIVSASIGLTIGDFFNFFQAGPGQLTFVRSGTQINTAETLKTRKSGSSCALIYVGTNVFDLTGDLELL